MTEMSWRILKYEKRRLYRNAFASPQRCSRHEIAARLESLLLPTVDRASSIPSLLTRKSTGKSFWYPWDVVKLVWLNVWSPIKSVSLGAPVLKEEVRWRVVDRWVRSKTFSSGLSSQKWRYTARSIYYQVLTPLTLTSEEPEAHHSQRTEGTPPTLGRSQPYEPEAPRRR